MKRAPAEKIVALIIAIARTGIIQIVFGDDTVALRIAAAMAMNCIFC